MPTVWYEPKALKFVVRLASDYVSRGCFQIETDLYADVLHVYCLFVLRKSVWPGFAQ